jgi:lysophospholipase L1-like esterase
MIPSKLYLLLNSLGLIILGGSIFLNFLLYSRANQYYSELNQTRLDPLGLSHYPVNIQQVPHLVDRRFRVVFLGDSRAAGWTSPQLGENQFINRGISSQTSIQTLQRFSAHVRPLKPHVVVIQVGVNDLKTIALFPESRQEIVRNCRSNIKRIVDESKNIGAVAIVTTIFPAGEIPLARKPFWSDEIDRAIKEMNAYIATLADEKTIVFDTFSILADSQGVMLSKYRFDELHLNEQGYTILNQELVRLIEKIERI